MDGTEVFQKLAKTSGFDAVYQDNKLNIIRDVWPEEAARLAQRFGPTGVSSGGQVGVGFLMEELARRSHILPFKNEPDEERLAQRILQSLHHGDMSVAGIARRPNPDILWLEKVNGLYIIRGIAEIKASARALADSHEQLKRQAQTMFEFCAAVERDRTNGLCDATFASAKISVARDLQKYAVVPRGAEQKAIEFLPTEWRCVGIEFSRHELLFLAREVWPQFESEALERASADIAADTREEFMKTFFDWARPLVAHILDMPQLTPEEINRVIVFAQLTDGLPLLPRDVHAAALFLERQWSVFQKRPGHILRFAQLNDKELRFFEAFYTFSRDKKQILCFLSWMRALKGQLVTANPALIRATGLDLVSLRKSLPQIH